MYRYRYTCTYSNVSIYKMFVPIHKLVYAHLYSYIHVNTIMFKPMDSYGK